LDSAPEKPAWPEHKLLDDADYANVWEVLAYDPKPMDAIIQQTGLSASEISSMLLMMELKGMVKKQANGHYLRT
jgi:DNA processing protein